MANFPALFEVQGYSLHTSSRHLSAQDISESLVSLSHSYQSDLPAETVGNSEAPKKKLGEDYYYNYDYYYEDDSEDYPGEEEDGFAKAKTPPTIWFPSKADCPDEKGSAGKKNTEDHKRRILRDKRKEFICFIPFPFPAQTSGHFNTFQLFAFLLSMFNMSTILVSNANSNNRNNNLNSNQANANENDINESNTNAEVTAMNMITNLGKRSAESGNSENHQDIEQKWEAAEKLLELWNGDTNSESEDAYA